MSRLQDQLFEIVEGQMERKFRAVTIEFSQYKIKYSVIHISFWNWIVPSWNVHKNYWHEIQQYLLKCFHRADLLKSENFISDLSTLSLLRWFCFWYWDRLNGLGRNWYTIEFRNVGQMAPGFQWKVEIYHISSFATILDREEVGWQKWG